MNRPATPFRTRPSPSPPTTGASCPRTRRRWRLRYSTRCGIDKADLASTRGDCSAQRGDESPQIRQRPDTARSLATSHLIGGAPPTAKYNPLATKTPEKPHGGPELPRDRDLIGALLPNADARASWWADPLEARAAGVQHKAWTAPGFSAELTGRDRTRFTRGLSQSPSPSCPEPARAARVHVQASAKDGGCMSFDHVLNPGATTLKGTSPRIPAMTAWA